MKSISLRLAVLLVGFAFTLFLIVPPTSADEWNLETKITPDHPIEVPGAVLDANTTYTIALMDSPAERHVVRVYNADRSQMLTQFIAVSDERLQPVDKTTFEFIEVPAGHPAPVQSWFYPGRRIGLEFLYPQQDRDRFAAYFREQRTEQVARVEPPAEPAPVEQIAEPPVVDQTASVEPPAEPIIEQPQAAEPEVQPEPPLVAQNTEPVGREELPRTAGEVQIFGLLGALATTLGVGLRMLRS